MTLASIVGALGGSALLLAVIRLIYATGRIVKGQEELQSAFTEHRRDTKADSREMNDKLDELSDRVIVLEVASGYGDRRHLARRTDDQHFRDLRKMVNGDE